jgi:hypothetical protein
MSERAVAAGCAEVNGSGLVPFNCLTGRTCLNILFYVKFAVVPPNLAFHTVVRFMDTKMAVEWLIMV